MLTERQAETLRMLRRGNLTAQEVGEKLAAGGVAKAGGAILAGLERRRLVCRGVRGGGSAWKWEWAILADGMKALREYDSCAT